ncbi:MAG: thiamine pyrophosphate-binding protein, partial [Desulfosporosinus sp.]
MYSDNKSVQILISLLKEFGVKSAVLSPGTRNVPIVHSLEKDPYFQCYSIVDERSAAYFAMGLALETRQPVLISCTSGTAPTNYTSAVCEAFYQHLPLVVLTSDRNPYYLNQLEDQMVPQTELYKGFCKKSVSLPIIKDDKDYWYCRRIVNEALLEMNHHGSGPVH